MKKIILFLMLASVGVLQAQKVKFEKRNNTSIIIIQEK